VLVRQRQTTLAARDRYIFFLVMRLLPPAFEEPCGAVNVPQVPK